MVRVAAEFPAASKGVVHDGAGEAAGVVGVHVFFCEVVYYVAWFACC